MGQITNFPDGVYATPNIGGGLDMFSASNIYFVDGDNGADGNNGLSPANATKTIQKAINLAVAHGGVIYVKAINMAAGSADPGSYAETLIIPATSSRIALIGITPNRTQGGLPQIKKGSGSAALLTIRSPGCLVANLGFNGAGSTGGGILLDDDSSTKTAFGTTILNSHFKNCAGSTATSSKTGGAIQWSAAGNAWQVLIKNNRFYKNVGDVVLIGTTRSVPQDISITDNEFSDSASSTDSNLYLAAGSGMTGLTIARNIFGAYPALVSGAVASYMDLTGCTGTMANNFFGSTGKTFGAIGNVKISTTVLMAGNYQESGLIART